MIAPAVCPRCGGKMLSERDTSDLRRVVESCLNCGYYREMTLRKEDEVPTFQKIEPPRAENTERKADELDAYAASVRRLLTVRAEIDVAEKRLSELYREQNVARVEAAAARKALDARLGTLGRGLKQPGKAVLTPAKLAHLAVARQRSAEARHERKAQNGAAVSA